MISAPSFDVALHIIAQLKGARGQYMPWGPSSRSQNPSSGPHWSTKVLSKHLENMLEFPKHDRREKNISSCKSIEFKTVYRHSEQLTMACWWKTSEQNLPGVPGTGQQEIVTVTHRANWGQANYAKGLPTLCCASKEEQCSQPQDAKQVTISLAWDLLLSGWSFFIIWSSLYIHTIGDSRICIMSSMVCAWFLQAWLGCQLGRNRKKLCGTAALSASTKPTFQPTWTPSFLMSRINLLTDPVWPALRVIVMDSQSIWNKQPSTHTEVTVINPRVSSTHGNWEAKKSLHIHTVLVPSDQELSVWHPGCLTWEQLHWSLGNVSSVQFNQNWLKH